VIAMMAGRAAIQRRDIHRAELVIALSESFGEQLARDYGYPADRIAVVPNPIDLGRLAPPERRPARGERPLILFVSRIAVRKGVESVVRLSHRLGDTGAARLAVVGGLTKWSDYRVLLGDLDPRSAEYRRRLSEEELATLYREADVLIQPSRFEPFGLTVAEALASGVPVVASDQVGAAKHVDRAVCRVVPAGDDDALERGVDGLLADLASRRGSALRRQARLEAERLFAPAVASDRLAAALERFRKPARRSPAPAPSGNGRPRTRSLARARR
jgi:glycosyltransferase involved in cell wall biosynthesis